jgi:hypothetical protein
MLSKEDTTILLTSPDTPTEPHKKERHVQFNLSSLPVIEVCPPNSFNLQCCSKEDYCRKSVSQAKMSPQDLLDFYCFKLSLSP